MYLPVFATSPLQFGFKPGLSTELCTGLIKNVTAKYCFNDSPVFGCFLDTSKAFDRVDHCLLFEKLLSRNLPPPPPPPAIVRTVLLWYSEQEVSVLWNKTSSIKFTISNGCARVVFCHPFYLPSTWMTFCLSWRELVLGPITLWVRSDTCIHYASSHSLIFNPCKTQLIKFSRSNDFSLDRLSNFTFLGQELRFSQSVVHLGHIMICRIKMILPLSKKTCVAKLIVCYIFSRAAILLLKLSCFNLHFMELPMEAFLT